MAFKLDKAQKGERTALINKLQDAYSEVESAVERFNDQVEVLANDLQEKVEAFNTLVHEAKDWAENFAEEKRSEFDERSENWQEGDRGMTTEGWIEEWEGADLNHLDIELPALLELPGDDTAADQLGNLPDEPSY